MGTSLTIEFDEQPYLTVTDPIQVSVFSFVPLVEPNPSGLVLRFMHYGATKFTSDVTVGINANQTTQNKWQEEVLEFRVFWMTLQYHIAAALSSVWLGLISKRRDTTSLSHLWMCPGERRNVLCLPPCQALPDGSSGGPCKHLIGSWGGLSLFGNVEQPESLPSFPSLRLKLENL